MTNHKKVTVLNTSKEVLNKFIEIDERLDNRPRFIKVNTFVEAKSKITVGVEAFFIIMNNEFFSTPTFTIYNGLDWYHSPSVKQN